MRDDSDKDLTASQMAAVVAFMPEFNAALTAAHFMAGARNEETNTFDMCMHLAQEVKLVQSGNLRGLEAMLTAQAHALDVMFTSLAANAGGQMESGSPKDAESNLRLALKAQGQCRAAIEAISEIKGRRGQITTKHQGGRRRMEPRRELHSTEWVYERRSLMGAVSEIRNSCMEVLA